MSRVFRQRGQTQEPAILKRWLTASSLRYRIPGCQPAERSISRRCWRRSTRPVRTAAIRFRQPRYSARPPTRWSARSAGRTRNL